MEEAGSFGHVYSSNRFKRENPKRFMRIRIKIMELLKLQQNYGNPENMSLKKQ